MTCTDEHTYTYKGCFIWHVLMKHIYIQRLLYMTCTDETHIHTKAALYNMY